MADIYTLRRRGAARGRAAALSVAIAAHLAILAGLVLGLQAPTSQGGSLAVDVTLVPRWPAQSPRPLASQGPVARLPRVRKPANPPAALAAAPDDASATPQKAGEEPSGPTDLARLGAALRGSAVGCGLEGARLTSTERETCHERLGAGAADAAYITAVPPEKRAYYAALQASEVKMARDRLGGHAPGIVCGKDAQNRGFKLGGLPCAFTPSPSPWTPELDVRPP